MSGWEVFKRQPPNGLRSEVPFVLLRTAGQAVLNSAARALLPAKTVRVRLMYDQTERVVGMRPATENDEAAYKIGASGGVSIAAMLAHYGESIAENERVAVEMQDGVLVFQLPRLT